MGVKSDPPKLGRRTIENANIVSNGLNIVIV